MRLTIQILTLLIFTSNCFAVKKDLKSDETIIKIFNKREIKDLDRLVNFFETQICSGQKTNKINIQECYERFFKKMNQSEKAGEIILNISFAEQKIVYDQISKKTFDEIWEQGWKIRNNNDVRLKFYGLKTKGKYVEFLKEFGLVNSFVHEYHSSLQIAGDISPSMFAGTIKRFKEFDISDPKIRLLIAVHYLTINDNYKRKEKY